MGEDSWRWWPGEDRADPADRGDADRAPADERTQFERERDRVLYSDEFERLRGVTQVLSPTEGVVCHDRHTHSIRVEQLSLRMATNERLLQSRPSWAPSDEVIPWAAAAAALAHDLGHPPFGHVAESELNTLLTSAPFRDPDGYEGNAQSFRILTRLACHRAGGRGLRLSRRVLRGVLKYPWLSSDIPVEFGDKRKYGAYLDDKDAFAFAVGVRSGTRGPRSIEAAIMDAADAITYSVHDMFDFYRAGLIDLGRLGQLELSMPASEAVEAFMLVASGFGAFADSRRDRELIQSGTSQLITLLIDGHNLSWSQADGWDLRPTPEMKSVMSLMQSLTKRFVIDSDKLAVTQVGHRRVIRRLFKTFFRALIRSEARLFAAFFRDEAERLADRVQDSIPESVRELLDKGLPIEAQSVETQVLICECGRLAADAVATLSDSQALALHARISGVLPVDGFLA